MRTTLSLDDDTLAAARKLAVARNEPLGRVVSQLMRQGLTMRSTYPGADEGFFVFSVAEDSPPIRLEDVKRDEDAPG